MADCGGNSLDRFNEVLDEGSEVAVPFVEREPDALHGSRRQPLTEQRRPSAPGWTGDQRQRLPEPLVQPREQAWAQDDIAAKLRPQELCESDSRRLLPEHSTSPCRLLGFWRNRRLQRCATRSPSILSDHNMRLLKRRKSAIEPIPSPVASAPRNLQGGLKSVNAG